MNILVAAAVLLLSQEPMSPDVKLPNGWQIVHTSLGFIKGPAGEEIVFPNYVASGFVASVQYEMDPASLHLQAVLNQRLTQVTVTSKGLVAVSFPPVAPAPPSLVFDFWMQAHSPRQAAQMVMISLTRLEAHGIAGEPDKRMLGKFRIGARDYPYDHLRVDGSFKLDIRDSQWIAVRGKSKLTRTELAFPSTVPWKQEMQLLSGTLSVAEGPDGRIWARFVTPNKATASFVASTGDPQAAVLAVFAALTYRQTN